VELEGADAEHHVSNITFKNVQILDSPLTKESPHLRMGEHVEAVEVSHD
jgi:hypothetical protein